MKYIVLISIDSLRADALGCYGNADNNTKHLDHYAEKGMLFKNVISQAPYTVSSHASMLTGLYPFNHGLRKQFTKHKLGKEHLHLLYGLREMGYSLRSFVGFRVFGSEFGYDLWDYQGWSKILSIQKRLPEKSEKGFFVFVHYWGVHTPYFLTNISRGAWHSLSLRFEKMARMIICTSPSLTGYPESFSAERTIKCGRSGRPSAGTSTGKSKNSRKIMNMEHSCMIPCSKSR